MPETQRKFYRILEVTAGTYDRVSWTVTRKRSRITENSQMAFLGTVAGYTLGDKQSREFIREKICVLNLSKMTGNRL